MPTQAFIKKRSAPPLERPLSRHLLRTLLALRLLALRLLALHLPAILPAALAGPEGQATVLSIGDGDTIRVQQGRQRITVRLACIDAPEMAQVPYGARARGHLVKHLQPGASVTLHPIAIDRYGRMVAEVIGESNLGLAMVEEGQAFAYRKYLDRCDARQYLEAELRASRHRRGVWQVPAGITRPWEFRRGGSWARPDNDTGSSPDGRR